MQFPGGRTNHGKRTTAVRIELYSWNDGRVGGGWPNERAVVRRLGRPAYTAQAGSPAPDCEDTYAAQWLGGLSLAGRLSLTYVRFVVDR